MPPATHAHPYQATIVQDDDLLLHRGDAVRDATLKRLKAWGVDVVRVSVIWADVSENATSTGARRKRFRAGRPNTYPKTNWDRYDRLVRACVVLRIECLLNPTGPGPPWAHPPETPTGRQRTLRPNPTEFGKFMRALGRRYSGRYKDENDRRDTLPKVYRWSIWNEPNLTGWLTPQWRNVRGINYIEAARYYRALWFAARRALDATGHANDTVFIGETSPLGYAHTPGVTSGPIPFIRELFCVDSHLRRFRGRAARIRGCTGPRRNFRAAGYAHHPYGRTAPFRPDPHPDSITTANIGDLERLLDGIARSTGQIPVGLPILFTEFGYESNPPDNFRGVPHETVAQYMNEVEAAAHANPRILSVAQFLLRDSGPNKAARAGSSGYWFRFQTGLLTYEERPKPEVVNAFLLPLVVTSIGEDSLGRARVTVWGHVRFLERGGRTKVYLRYSVNGREVTIGDPIEVTDPFGYFTATVAVPRPGVVRALAFDNDTFPVYSRALLFP